MAYIYNNNVQFSDTFQLDAFNRLRVSQITSLLDLKHTYDKLPLIVNEATGGTVTSTFSQTNACVTMSVTGVSSYVIRQSKIYPPYQAGKGQIFEASFSNFQIETDVIKRVGGFHSSTASTYDTQFDGYFLESNGVTNKIAFFIYRSGNLTYSSETSNWLTDHGIDPSSIDWSKVQLMVVDYQWLGVGRMRFGLVFSGSPYLFATHSATNDDTEVYMSSPNQPIRYEIKSSGGNGSFTQICSQISTEGSLNELNETTVVNHPNTTTLSISGTKYPYIGIRMKPGIKNVIPKLQDLDIINTSNDDYLITIEVNPQLSASVSWSDISNTPIQYSLQSGVTTVTGSGYAIQSSVRPQGTSSLSTFDLKNNQINIGENINGSLDELWVCITPLGANATFRGALNVIYLR
jgi:hypothetical protein